MKRIQRLLRFVNQSLLREFILILLIASALGIVWQCVTLLFFKFHYFYHEITALEWHQHKGVDVWFFMIGIFLITSFLAFLKQKPPNIYGDAHFASYNEIKKAKLFAEQGILLGRAYGKDLLLDGYEHVTLFAPTGTGKTTSLTIPNLLTWQGSCVVSDIKLQLYAQTSTYRQSIGQKVFLWNPGSREGVSHCYNPLDIISDNPHTRIDEIQKIAAILIPDNPKSEPIWQIHSRFLFVALTLYVLDTDGLEKNIGEVVRAVKNTPNFAIFVAELLKDRQDLDPLCKANFLKFLELHEKTRLSILATFQSYFELFDNPLIEAATSKSDFDIRQLRKETMTVYVGVTNDNLVRLSPLLTIFYQQVADVMTRNVPKEDEPYGVLFLMDEFSALRRMESFHKNIGLYREYKLRMVIIIQELSQLYDIYGRDGAKVFINAKVRIAYTQNDEETCQLIASKLGDTTIKVKNTSRQVGSDIFSKSQNSESTYYTARPLLLPQEIRLLPEDKAIIIIQGHQPVYAEKIRWFNELKYKEKTLVSLG